MNIGDQVKLIKVHKSHHISLRVYFEKGITGEIRDVNRNGSFSVRFGTALISYDVKPRYLEVIK